MFSLFFRLELANVCLGSSNSGLWKASDGLDHGTGHFATRRSTLRLAVVDSVALAVYQVKRDGCHRLKRLPKELELRP